MMTKYDQERIVAKYEQFCYKNGIDSDKFDINAEMDSNISYWENVEIIEDKLSILKDSLIMQQANKPISRPDLKNTNPLKLNLDNTDSIAVIGDRSTGKTNLVFYLLNNYRGVRDVYLYGYPKKLPGFKRVSSWTDLLKLTDSIIYIDEVHRYIKLYDRRANIELMELLSFLRHENNTLIFSTQLSQFITKGVEASIQTWLIKRLDILSLKNGSKPKRILNEIADARITEKGMALENNEVISYDNLQEIGFNGIYTFSDQRIGKDWKRNHDKNSEKNSEKNSDKVAATPQAAEKAESPQETRVDTDDKTGDYADLCF